MTPNRSRNRVGKRFVRWHEVRDHVVDLDPSSHPVERPIEYFEKHDLLKPVRRIRPRQDVEKARSHWWEYKRSKRREG